MASIYKNYSFEVYLKYVLQTVDRIHSANLLYNDRRIFIMMYEIESPALLKKFLASN